MEQFIGECIDISYEGLGVVKHDDYVVFVNDILVGETALINIDSSKKKFAFGSVVEYKTVSKNRVKPQCESYSNCGGCQTSHFNHEETVKFKNNVVKNNFVKMKLDVETVNCINDVASYDYRNKNIFFFEEKNGNVVCGPYKNKSNEVIDGECLFATPLHSKVVEVINKNKVSIKKVLKAVMYRKVDDGVALSFVIYKDDKDLDSAIDELEKYFTQISVIYNRSNKVLLSNKHQIITQEKEPTISLGDFQFKIRPTSFFQINTNVARQMYDKIIEIGNLKNTDVVLDAYSGVGSIGIYVSEHVKQVVGIEANGDAVKCAKENAENNNVENCDFYCGDVINSAQVIDKKFDVAIINPPRGGSNEEFLSFLNDSEIDRVVYMSCNGATQARDVKFLCDLGYKVDNVHVFDMFPHTYHTETLIVLEK